MKSSLGKLGVVLLIGILIFGYAEVWGADWKFFGETVRDTKSYCNVWFYDTDSLSFSKSNILVWVKIFKAYWPPMDNLTNEYYTHDFYKFLDYQKILFKLNCRNKTFERLSTVFYSKNGNVIGSLGFGELDYIVPETILEGLYETVCGK